MKKSLAALLTITLTANNLLASTQPQTCIAKNLVCECYTPEEVLKLSNLILENKFCQFELEQYKHLQVSAEEKAWYSDPTIVIGGVTLSLVVGGMVGYLIGQRSK